MMILFTIMWHSVHEDFIVAQHIKPYWSCSPKPTFKSVGEPDQYNTCYAPVHLRELNWVVTLSLLPASYLGDKPLLWHWDHSGSKGRREVFRLIFCQRMLVLVGLGQLSLLQFSPDNIAHFSDKSFFAVPKFIRCLI